MGILGVKTLIFVQKLLSRNGQVPLIVMLRLEKCVTSLKCRLVKHVKDSRGNAYFSLKNVKNIQKKAK